MATIVIDIDFKMWDLVYLKTDHDQRERMVTAINIRGSRITYELSCGTDATWHEKQEITTEKNILIDT